MRLGYFYASDEKALEDIASMRPRRMRLGYVASPLKNTSRRPSFKEAEAHAPRILSYAALEYGRSISLQ